jgi:hypothetical protein
MNNTRGICPSRSAPVPHVITRTIIQEISTSQSCILDYQSETSKAVDQYPTVYVIVRQKCFRNNACMSIFCIPRLFFLYVASKLWVYDVDVD